MQQKNLFCTLAFWFVQSMLARNYYNFKLIALFLAFSINFLLLFFKVSLFALKMTTAYQKARHTSYLHITDFITLLCVMSQVSKATSELTAGLGGGDDDGVAEIGGGDGESGDSDEDDIMELISMAEHVYYLQPLLRLISALHTIIAFAMMVAYYCLKVCIRPNHCFILLPSLSEPMFQVIMQLLGLHVITLTCA